MQPPEKISGFSGKAAVMAERRVLALQTSTYIHPSCRQEYARQLLNGGSTPQVSRCEFPRAFAWLRRDSSIGVIAEKRACEKTLFSRRKSEQLFFVCAMIRTLVEPPI
jgi:hypothetical protein